MNPNPFALLLVACFLLLPENLHATAQIGDYLDFDGKRVEIYSTPLEDYFSEDKNRKRPDFGILSSACWRGYVALWKISGKKLHLVSLHAPDHEKMPPLGKEYPLKKVFPDSSGAVVATWYTGVLRIPEGERIRYVHMGFGSTYERDRYLTIKEGKVVATRVIDNKGFGATRSNSDLEWVAMADEPAEDDGNWTDARRLKQEGARKKDEPVTTRGIFFPRSKVEPAMLWIPMTPTTRSVRFELSDLPKEPKISGGSHAEVVVTFDAATDTLKVKSLRELEAGETIHHRDFKAPETEIEADVPANNGK